MLYSFRSDGYVQQFAVRPVYDVVVGRDGARDDCLAESPRGFDDRLGNAGRRVAGEQYAALVRGYHSLDDDGDVDEFVVEASVLTIIDRALGKQRCPTSADPVDEFGFFDVEKRLLLPCERRVREVLSSRGRSHGDRGVLSELVVRRRDLLAYLLGEFRFQDQRLRPFGSAGQGFGVGRIVVDGVEQRLVQ